MDNGAAVEWGLRRASKPPYLYDGIGGIIEGFALILQDNETLMTI